MNTIKALKGLLSLLALATAVTACSDEDTPGTNVAAPAESSITTETTASSVSVEWGSVENAKQYGVVLYDMKNEAVDAAVTKGNTAVFKKLTPATDYIISLVSYGTYDGILENVPETRITVRTDDPAPLATPEVTAHRKQGSGYRIAWKLIIGAVNYEYECKNVTTGEDYSGSVKTSTVTLTGLTSGDYTFRLRAIPEDPQYLTSEWSDPITFTY